MGHAQRFIELRALHLPVQHQAAAKRFSLEDLNCLKLGLADVHARRHVELHDEAVALRLAVPAAARGFAAQQRCWCQGRASTSWRLGPQPQARRRTCWLTWHDGSVGAGIGGGVFLQKRRGAQGLGGGAYSRSNGKLQWM